MRTIKSESRIAKGIVIIFAMCMFLSVFFMFGREKASGNILFRIKETSEFRTGDGYIQPFFDLGGSVTAELLWQQSNSGGDESYAITGIVDDWVDYIREYPADRENVKLFIYADNRYEDSSDYSNFNFEIANNAFKYSSYSDLVFTELEFEKAWEWLDYEEGDIVSLLTSIGDNAFERGDFKLADMSGMQLLSNIGEYAFYDCDSLNVVDLSGSGIKTIGKWAFSGCAELYSIKLDDCEDVTLGRGAFEKCTALTALDLKNSGVVSIGEYAFGATRMLKQIDFGNAPIKVIGANAFSDSGLESLDLSGLKDLTEIHALAFYNCQNLKTVRMGYVPQVNETIFNLCSGLESITFDSKATYDYYKEAGTFSSLSVSLLYDDDTTGNEPGSDTPKPNDYLPWIFVLVAVVAAGAGFAVYILIRRKRLMAKATDGATSKANAVNTLAAVFETAATADAGEAYNSESDVSNANGSKDGDALPLEFNLTRRELEVAKMMLEGKKRKEIADLLFVSENTIKTHVNSIFNKTKCSDQLGFLLKYGKK